MRLLILNTREPNLEVHRTNAVVDGFAALLGNDNVHLAQYDNACALFQKTSCDAALLFDGRGMRVPIVKELLRLSPLKIFWIAEDPYELPADAKHAAWFDFVFTNACGSVSAYGGKATPLPLGASALAEEPLPLSRRYRDVFFAGTARPNRAAILRELIPLLDGLKTQFFLPNNPAAPEPQLPIPRHEWDVRLCHDDFLTAARTSKIVLYMGRDDAAGGPRDRTESPAGRLFEVAALGTAQVAVADPADIAPYFEPGKEIIVAPTVAEAARAMRELLADPARLQSIGQASRRRAIADHTYASRARTILDHVAGHLSRRPQTASPSRRSRPLRVLLVAGEKRTQQPWDNAATHVKNILNGLGRAFDFHHLYARANGAKREIVHCDCRTGREHIVDSGRRDHFRQWVIPQQDAAFQKLLLEEDIDIVHFCDFLHHSFGYVWVAQALGRPTLLDLRDYTLVCPRYDLLDDQHKFCSLPAKETCDACLWKTAKLPRGSQTLRRRLTASICHAVDRIHFVSESQRLLVQQVLPIRKEKIRVQGANGSNGLIARETLEKELQTVETAYRELAELYHITGEPRTFPLDEDAFSPIPIDAVAPKGIPPDQSLWDNIKRLYRTQGAYGVARRACVRAFCGRRGL
jgi:glycosyltransferase involved in cell wall biosynthesis